MQWIWSYPLWTLLLLAVISFVLTYFLYQKASQKFEISKTWIYFLSILRFISIFSIGLLLLNPLLKYISNEKVEPIILVLDDQSASIPLGMSTNELQNFQNQFTQLKSDLSQKYKVLSYAFGIDLLDTLNAQNPYTEKGTDIHKALESVKKRNVGQHIGAVILASDGLYNYGTNPIYSNSFSGVPIYTIALGDTTTQTDLWVQRLRYNDVVYLGDEMQLLIDLAAENLNQKNIQVQLKNASGQVLQQSSTTIKSNEWNETLEMKILCNQPGIHRYTVSVSHIDGEKTHNNNHQEFYVQVIDGRQKIVVLYDAPHPDVKFIKEVLSDMKNIDLTVSSVESFSNTSSKIDLLILHGLPSIRDRNYFQTLNKTIQSVSSVWWIVSTQTDLTNLNQMQNLVQFQQIQRSPNDVTPSFQNSYQKFFVSESALEWLQKVPPLTAPYGQYQTSTQAEICWTQKVGAVQTAQPLLLTGDEKGKKYALLLGEGIWRWPMQEYFHYEEKSRSKEWVERLVQYISTPSDHRPFRLRTNKTIYLESEWISVEAAVYNASAQMVNQADVKLVLNNDQGLQQEFLMDKTQNAYTYNLGKLSAGQYTLQGYTELGNKKLKSSYQFAVKNYELETQRTKADYTTLNTLALQHGGEMIHHTEISKLKSIIEDDERIKPIFQENSHSKSLIDIKWLLLIIIGSMGLEWFLRRYFGQY